MEFLTSYENAEALASVGLKRETPRFWAPVVLVATTPEDYVVYADSTRVLYLKRSWVDAVFVGGKFRDPNVIGPHPETVDTTKNH